MMRSKARTRSDMRLSQKMATDKIEIRTGKKDATSRGRRPHKEAPHGPVPPPILILHLHEPKNKKGRF